MENDEMHFGWVTPNEASALAEAGLPESTADLFYKVLDDGSHELVLRKEDGGEYVPCWSIGCLIAMLPSVYIDKHNVQYAPSVDSFGCGYYEIDRLHGIMYTDETVAVFPNTRKSHSVVNLVLWALKGNFIKTDRI